MAQVGHDPAQEAATLASYTLASQPTITLLVDSKDRPVDQLRDQLAYLRAHPLLQGALAKAPRIRMSAESALTDDLLSLLLQAARDLRTLSAGRLQLSSDTHKWTVWSVQELSFEQVSLSGLGRLPLCAEGHTCRVTCEEVLVDVVSQEVSNRVKERYWCMHNSLSGHVTLCRARTRMDRCMHVRCVGYLLCTCHACTCDCSVQLLRAVELLALQNMTHMRDLHACVSPGMHFSYWRCTMHAYAALD